MLPEVRPITDLARGAGKLVELARQRRAPIVITQRGRDAAVLMPIELYREIEARLVRRIDSPRLVRPVGADPRHFEMEVTVDPENGEGGRAV
ncbi:MAG TPA: type II toxin-antitoxin system Phd/YefM family antitoxin [Chloroflexota bacterium]|jgi:prevent-host-death family protein|nr:type II toxin-antitoxin system Phd/YefM family antitoxin [Chloroflexota bacterium]